MSICWFNLVADPISFQYGYLSLIIGNLARILSNIRGELAHIVLLENMPGCMSQGMLS